MQKVKGRIDVTRKINPFYVYQKIDSFQSTVQTQHGVMNADLKSSESSR